MSENKIEESEVRSPAERMAEEKLKEELSKPDAGSRPEDVAATFFKVYLPVFFRTIDQMSGRQLRRLTKALVSWPLEMSDYKPPNQVEKDAFSVGSELIKTKFMMVLHTEKERLDAKKEKQEAKESEEGNDSGKTGNSEEAE